MAEQNLTYRIGDFLLDVSNRQLSQCGAPLDLNARYFDALVLLVREHGQLVEKDRFFEEVWGDVVVSDSALTQGIKDIRKRLGDDAANPRYIQTVPRYGYRFIGPVEVVPSEPIASPVLADTVAEAAPWTGDGLPHTEREGWLPRADHLPFLAAALWGGAGALGGAAAGVLGGLLYGSALAHSPDAGLGTASILLVLLALNVMVGAVGGAGVSIGMAVASLIAGQSLRWRLLGAAVGGLVVGGAANLLGVDAFNLLLGAAPSGITGGLEGAALGLALALGARLGGLGDAPRWRTVAGAGIAGAVVGALIPALGGHLMGGSLDLLAQSFADSRLQLDAIGRLFGEVRFGPTTQVILGAVEGLLFTSCVAGALVVTRDALSATPGPPDA